MVQVQGLAVEVAGRLADLEKLLDLRMVDVEIHRRRSPAQRPLADGQGQAVHHPYEGDDARGLARTLDLLPDGPHATPVGADATAVRRQEHVLVPGADNALKAVGHGIQEARDGQAAVGPAIGQDRRRRHEPQTGDVVIDPLGVLGIVGIGRGDPGKHVLIALTLEQITILQRGLAEVGQQGVPRAVDLHMLHEAEPRPFGLSCRLADPHLGLRLNLCCFSADHRPKPQEIRNGGPRRPTRERCLTHRCSRVIPPQPTIWCANAPRLVNGQIGRHPDFFVNKSLITGDSQAPC